ARFDDAKPAPRGISGCGHEALQSGGEPPLEFRCAPFEGALPDLRRCQEELGSWTREFRLRFVARDRLPVAEDDGAAAEEPVAEGTWGGAPQAGDRGQITH